MKIKLKEMRFDYEDHGNYDELVTVRMVKLREVRETNRAEYRLNKLWRILQNAQHRINVGDA